MSESTKRATEEKISWEELQQMMDENTILSVQIKGVVNAGVIAYVQGVRGFIPASQLSTSYVEDLNEWLNKTIDVKIITVDAEQKRLVLSGRAAQQEKVAAERAAQIEAISVGDIFEGTVEKITSYGAFIRLENNLSGLVHISQIADKRVEKVTDYLQMGQEVPVKVLEVDRQGRIRLSIKEATEQSQPAAAPEAPAAEQGE